MSEQMYYLLLALRSSGHGYELMKTVERISHNRVHLGPGTLYGLLNRLLADGLICLTEMSARRKVYALTPEGEGALRAEYSRLQAMVLDGMVLKRRLE